MARRNRINLTAEQRARREAAAAFLTRWYADSVGGMVLADYAAGRVRTVVAELPPRTRPPESGR